MLYKKLPSKGASSFLGHQNSYPFRIPVPLIGRKKMAKRVLDRLRSASLLTKVRPMSGTGSGE